MGIRSRLLLAMPPIETLVSRCGLPELPNVCPVNKFYIHMPRNQK